MCLYVSDVVLVKWIKVSCGDDLWANLHICAYFSHIHVALNSSVYEVASRNAVGIELSAFTFVTWLIINKGKRGFTRTCWKYKLQLSLKAR